MSTSTTMRLVQGQMIAMGVPIFEVGAYKPARDDGAREPEMLLRTWDFESVARSVGWLKMQNVRGRNIYIRPHGEHPLSLLDDLTFSSVERMKSEGFNPALVVETSVGNFQAWMNHGQVLSRELSTRAARLLSRRFQGDPSSADWRHFGRLAGFTNRKEKHRREDGLSPFVRLIEASGEVYAQSASFVSKLREDFEMARRTRLQRAPGTMPSTSSHLRTIADFRERPEYQQDGNRIDMAYAIYALSHGVKEDSVRAAIASRDLAHKGAEKRQADYIERTIQKAWMAISGRTLER